MNRNYFRLNPECFLTVGEKRSVIQNLSTKEAIWLDEEKTKDISKAEYNHPVDANKEVFQVLSRKEWGFFSDKKIFIDKLRTINVFREKRLWKETPYIGLAVLQLTNECNGACSFCGEYFCPICTVHENDAPEINSFDAGQWLELIDELNYFGAKNILLTGGEPLLFEGVDRIVEHALKIGLTTQVHTNGILPPKDVFKRAVVSILVSERDDLDLVLENYKNFNNIILFLMEFDENSVKNTINKNWKVMRTSFKPPVIDKSKLLETDLDQFFAKRLYDNCLNSKIHITHNGSVIPCFGSKNETIGNIQSDGFSPVFKNLINDYWSIPINKVDETRKCTNCEFRYACAACRNLNVEEQCRYDIENSRWL